MPKLYEWFFILLQPMSGDKLYDLLNGVEFLNANVVIWILYGLFLFLMLLLLRQVSIGIRSAIGEGDNIYLAISIAGLVSGFVVGFPHLMLMMVYYGSATADQLVRVGPFALPGFELFHRSVLPLDVKAIDLFLIDGNFWSQVRRSLFLWEEGARGLWAYLLIIILMTVPFLRLWTAPFVMGFVAAAVVPAVLTGFFTVGPFAFALMSVLCVFALGLNGLIRRIITGAD